MRLKKNNFIARLFSKGKPAPKIYDAREFGLSKDGFDHRAQEVVKTLQGHGYQAYVVGGGVRDQLLNLHPKDFDIATNARPEQVKKCFQRCIIIGRRFRLAHVYFGRYDFVEVATFRREQAFVSKHVKSAFQKNGIVARDNLYGCLEEDAFRRDFTVNALYYDPTHHHIIDFNEGMQDVQKKILRLIGKPSIRLREDPVRILRALRISNKIKFEIDEATFRAMPKFIPLLEEIAGGRIFDEYQKMFLHGDALKNFESLQQFKILPHFFPKLQESLEDPKTLKMIKHALQNTDQRYQSGKTINPAFLISVFLWKIMSDRQAVLRKKTHPREAYLKAVNEVLKEQSRKTSMPGYLLEFVEQVWGLQRQLERRQLTKALSIVTHTRYRAAYDFLLLRAEMGEVKSSLCQWWNQLHLMNDEERVAFLDSQNENQITRTLPLS